MIKKQTYISFLSHHPSSGAYQTTVTLLFLGSFFDVADSQLASHKATFERVCWYLKKLDHGIYGIRKGFEPLRSSAMMQKPLLLGARDAYAQDRKSTRLNSSHVSISYAVFCLKKKKQIYN